jgi:hypothetical protein
MNRLCGQTRWDAIADAASWKFIFHGNGASQGTLFAIERGYYNTGTIGERGIAAPPDACPIGCGKFKGSLTWRWGGLGTQWVTEDF